MYDICGCVIVCVCGFVCVYICMWLCDCLCVLCEMLACVRRVWHMSIQINEEK